MKTLAIAVLGLLTAAGPARAVVERSLVFADPDAPGDRLPCPGLRLVPLRADVQGDGREDLVLVGDEGTAIVFGDAAGLPPTLDWESADVRLPGATVLPDVVGDANGDGLDDVLVIHAGNVHLLFGRDSWPAELTPASEAGASVRLAAASGFVPWSVDLGDVDGDGIDDLVLAGSRARLYLGVADWPQALSERVPDCDIVLGLGYEGVEIGDVAADGLPDLVFGADPSAAGPDFSVVPGRADWPAELLDGVSAECGQRGSSHVRIGDVTGDGRADVVSWSPVSDAREVRVYEGGDVLTGELAPGRRVDLGFQRLVAPQNAVPGRLRVPRDSVQLGDINGDGRDDLAVLLWLGGARGRAPSATGLAIWSSPLAEPTGDFDHVDLVLFGADMACGVEKFSLLDARGTGSAELLAWESRDCTGEEPVLLAAPPSSSWPFPAGPTLHVDGGSGDDRSSGLSWDEPLATVSAAMERLDASFGEATVLVAGGRYPEQVVLGRQTRLLGGYRPGGGERDLNEFMPILDAGGVGGRPLTLVGSPQAWSSHADGFLLTGGVDDVAAGLSIGRGAHVVSNSIVTDNLGRVAAQPIESLCADDRGGFWTWEGCTPSCAVTAGVALADRSRLVNCLIVGNRIDPDFPWCPEPPPECVPVRGCTEATVLLVGGVRILGEGRLEQCTVADNDPPGLVGNSDDFVVERSVVWGNGVDVRVRGHGSFVDSLVGESPHDVGDSLREDPLFVDPAAGNYALSQVAAGQSADSPGLDASTLASDAACLGLNPDWCASQGSTRSDGAADDGLADLGWHAPRANAAPVFAGASLARAVGECTIVLGWSPASDDEPPIRYRVFGAAAPGEWDFSGEPLVELVDETSWVDRSVVWGEERHYVVRAVDSRGLAEDNLADASAIADDGLPPLAAIEPGESVACEVPLELVAEDACSGVVLVELHRSDRHDFTPEPATLLAPDPGDSFLDLVPTNGNWHYRLVVRDAAGNERVSPVRSAHVAACTADLPPPGEVPRLLIARQGAEALVSWLPAPSADRHRLYRGTLAALRSGSPDHAAGVGPDGRLDTADDVGACASGPLELRQLLDGWPGDLYFLASGLNDAGEGTLGVDSLGRARPPGFVDCP